jgi:hypothetical protein
MLLEFSLNVHWMRLQGVPIEAVSLHPGVIATELFRFGLNRLFKPFAPLMRPVIKSIPQVRLLSMFTERSLNVH